MAILREDTYMGLAPGLNSSGEFVLSQTKYAVADLSSGTADIASTLSGAWLYEDSGSFTTISTYTLPYPEAGAFYGFVWSGNNTTINSIVVRTPSSLVDILVSGLLADDSTNTGVEFESSGLATGQVVGFLGLSATRYVFMNFSNLISTSFTSATSTNLDQFAAWSAIDSTG